MFVKTVLQVVEEKQKCPSLKTDPQSDLEVLAEIDAN